MEEAITQLWSPFFMRRVVSIPDRRTAGRSEREFHGRGRGFRRVLPEGIRDDRLCQPEW